MESIAINHLYQKAPSVSYSYQANYEKCFTHLEATLVYNVLYSSIEMLRLSALQAIKSKFDIITFKTILKSPHRPKCFWEIPFDNVAANVISSILSIEDYLRILSREVCGHKSCSAFSEEVNGLNKTIKDNEIRHSIYKDHRAIDVMKEKFRHSYETYVKLKLYFSLLKATSDTALMKEQMKYILSTQQKEYKINEAIDRTQEKENIYLQTIQQYNILSKQEKDFDTYKQANNTKLMMLENEIEYWIARYDAEMEALESRKHQTENAITNANNSIIFFKESVIKSRKKISKELAVIEKLKADVAAIASKYTQPKEESLTPKKINPKKSKKKATPKKK